MNPKSVSKFPKALENSQAPWQHCCSVVKFHYWKLLSTLTT